jgi:hypothetical protein
LATRPVGEQQRPDTLRDLLSRLGGHDAVIPEPGGKSQPLVAVYGALAARALADDFADGERSIVAAEARLRL